MKITQQNIAERIGVTVGMVNHLLNGRRSVTWAMAKKLSEHFGRSPAWWMEADIAKIRRVLRSGKTDGSNQNGGHNGQQRRAA